MKQSALIILMLAALLSCRQKPKDAAQIDNKLAGDTTAKTDTASLRKLLEKSQKPDADIIEMLFNKDTLKIVTTLPHLYYPFGRHKAIKDIEKFISNSIIKDIYLINSQTNDSTAITQITTSSSIIKFFYENETSLQEIVSADIRDNNFHFLNKIKIGMSKEELLSVIFNKTPKIPTNVIKLISGLDGIQHYYYFKNDKLIEIKMVTDYMFEGK